MNLDSTKKRKIEAHARNQGTEKENQNIDGFAKKIDQFWKQQREKGPGQKN